MKHNLTKFTKKRRHKNEDRFACFNKQCRIMEKTIINGINRCFTKY